MVIEIPKKGLEPLTPGSTIQCSSQLSYFGMEQTRNFTTRIQDWTEFLAAELQSSGIPVVPAEPVVGFSIQIT
jgi:hypothetical protein